MAQKPLREAVVKQLLSVHWVGDSAPVLQCAAVGPQTTEKILLKEHPWLQDGKVVAKVDELFGKRGKRGYVKVAENVTEAWEWIESLRGTAVEIDGKTGVLAHFILEPFIEHTDEWYVAFQGARDHDEILFSEKGGVDIEEQGDSIRTIDVAFREEPDLAGLPTELHSVIAGLYRLYRSLDLGFLEINPLTISNGHVHLLDAVCRVDSNAAYRQSTTWGMEEIPDGFGASLTDTEKKIRDLDAKTGASLKFTLLHPEGRIWTMVAGGGASIIYADAITAQAPAAELANYGEWSGNPSTDEMEAYTGAILDLMIEKKKEQQALIIGGGIANFTDIAKTFAGIIKALEARQKDLQSIQIYVRRAGPNDTIGLEKLQTACDAMGIRCVTHGAELAMTEVVEMAVSDLSLSA